MRCTDEGDEADGEGEEKWAKNGGHMACRYEVCGDEIFGLDELSENG